MRTGTGVNGSAREAARALGNQSDDAGHILGKVLGGQGGKGNVFPQLPAINRGEYRVFENEVRKYINKNGTVDIDWSFVYKNGGTRPTDIIYNVSQNGKTVLYSVFGN
nr:DNA/RNA non-specific endonuclease [Brenneria sp. hezel4-2-4]